MEQQIQARPIIIAINKAVEDAELATKPIILPFSPLHPARLIIVQRRLSAIMPTLVSNITSSTHANRKCPVLAPGTPCPALAARHRKMVPPKRQIRRHDPNQAPKEEVEAEVEELGISR